MVEFIAEINSDTAIFGNKINGERNHANQGHGFISIKGFRCEITKCGSSKCKSFAHTYFKPYFKILADNIGDSMSGSRGILEPDIGYVGPLLKNSKKPKKGSQHRPFFSLNNYNDHPAICYPDTFSTNQVKENRVERQRIYLK